MRLALELRHEPQPRPGRGSGRGGGAQPSQGKGPLPALTPQSSVRHVHPGALPRGQCPPGLAVWWSRTPVGDPTGRLQGKQENEAPGQRQKGKLGRQQAGRPGNGTRSPAGAKLGRRDPTRPGHFLQARGRPRGESGPPPPPPSAPSQGPHVEDGRLHQAKAVMARGKREG